MSRLYAPVRPVDEALAGFESLMDEGIPQPIAALYETADSSIEALSRVTVSWQPGRQLTVRYRVVATGGALAGNRDVMGAAGKVPDGAVIVESPTAKVGLWVLPDDPKLPGLRSALDIPTVTRLLHDLGSLQDVAFARLRAYRPGRRAVVEVGAGSSSIFLKIVPPTEVEALHERHRFLAEYVPVPDSLGVARDLGIVVMRALPGRDLRSILREGNSAPPPEAVAAMVSSLPAPPLAWKSGSPLTSLPGVIDLLIRLLPDHHARLRRLESDIGEAKLDDPVPIHGDFHAAQVIVETGRPVGLIDVDTFGWGHCGDDAATMLGQLHLLARSCGSPGPVVELSRGLNRIWDASFDPVDLRRRTAAVVLGLATGPFRVQRPRWLEETIDRISVAEDWVGSARRVDERSLIATSG